MEEKYRNSLPLEIHKLLQQIGKNDKVTKPILFNKEVKIKQKNIKPSIPIIRNSHRAKSTIDLRSGHKEVIVDLLPSNRKLQKILNNSPQALLLKTDEQRMYRAISVQSMAFPEQIRLPKKEKEIQMEKTKRVKILAKVPVMPRTLEFTLTDKPENYKI